MRHYIIKLVGIATIIGFSFPTKVFAQEMCDTVDAGFKPLCKLKFENAGGVTAAIVQFILILAIVIALFFLIWGGIKWASSGGDRGKVAAARAQITHALIGLIIAFLAFFIINLVMAFFTGQGLDGLQIPKLV